MARHAQAEQAPLEYNGFVIESDVPMGAQKRGSGLRPAKYPFDYLEPGQSFHVPATEDMPKPAITLAGAVTNANHKWSHPSPDGATETKEVAAFEVDENGKRVKTADGKFIKTGTKLVTTVVRIQDRHFTIRTAEEGDPRGPGARVFRDI